MSALDSNLWRDALRVRAQPGFWRGVEELLDMPGFRARLAAEFPEGADAPAAMSRRDLIRLLGATAALGGLAGCMQEPRDQILPYAKNPKGTNPGEPRHYSTMMLMNGFAEGLLVKAQDGRPLKIDGSPEHPATLGGSSIHQQALLFELYDPQRAQAPTRRGVPVPYEDFVAQLAQLPDDSDGAGLRFLLEPTSSPLMGELLGRLQRKYPRSRAYFHSATAGTAATEGLLIGTGRVLQPRFDFSAASSVVSFAGDFLCGGPFSIRYARQFADRRRLLDGATSMNRLYVVETDLSVTGMSADNRLARRPSGVRDAALTLLAALVERAGPVDWNVPPVLRAALGSVVVSEDRRWLETVAGDLLARRGESVVLAGDSQPPQVHAVVHAINVLLGNVGRTVLYGPSPIVEASAVAGGLATLTEEMQAGAVDRLMILEGNPAYSAPAHPGFRELLPRVRHSAYLGLYANDTARLCEWFVPASHSLESWSDGRAVDGTLSVGQPLIRPLYDTRAPSEILSAFLGSADLGAGQILKLAWSGRTTLQGPGTWEAAVQQGFVPGTAFAAEAPPTRWDDVAKSVSQWKPRPVGEYELHLRPDIKVLDGRFANNLWLLELGDPVTKLTWDNAALVSPATAAFLGLADAQYVRITRGDQAIELPVIVLPGHADSAVTVPLGFGAEAKAWGGDWFSDALGTNAFPLRRSEDQSQPASVTLERLPKSGVLARTQTHWTMEGRPIGLTRTLDELRANPAVRSTTERLFSLIEPFEQRFPDQWGMAIDLSVCTGCSACVTACQAENNIPVVGKGGVVKSREMHWIRIDRYFEGRPERPGVVLQPMLCQHCEKAPCEYVCPVNATTHSPDGINEMTYNRCVGTRFCQNNCAWKVRRFNWFDYNIRKPPTLRMLMNPDVTVRARGVIEKCTYCVQRIREAQIDAEKETRPLRDLEVVTACQQACPSKAIVFGNIANPESEVSRWMKQPRTYQVLEELGTRPRTRYLAQIRNPNPGLG